MARWYKTDLQVASPLGGFRMDNGDCSTAAAKKQAAETFVAHIKDAGIEVFAVTDHNSTEMLEEIREAAIAAGLTMFPGMELSTGTGSDGVHLLLIGDPGADIDALKFAWLNAAGFDADHPAMYNGEHMPAQRSFIDILNNLPEDTLAIAPHVFNDNGIASRRSVQNDRIKWQSLHHDRLSALDVGVPGESEGWNKLFRERRLDRFPVVKRMAYVSTSDAYAPDGLIHHSWIRMNEPNLESLQQAFLDYEARIVCDWESRIPGGDPNKISHAYIKSVSLERLANSDESLSVEFDPRLTVIIGGRGSGKSTIIQGLRAAYSSGSSLPEVIEAESDKYRQEVFLGAKISSSFVEALSGTEGAIVWTSERGTEVASGAKAIPVRVVSQKELYERTSGDRTLGQRTSANMLALVDEALEDDNVAAELSRRGLNSAPMRSGYFETELGEISSRYSQAVTKRLESDRRIAVRENLVRDIESTQRKLDALDDEDQKSSLQLAQGTLADDDAITGFIERLNSWLEGIRELDDLISPDFNTEIAASTFGPLLHAASVLNGYVQSAEGEVTSAVAAIVAVRQDPESAYSSELRRATEFKAEYEAKLQALGVDLSQYEALQAQLTAAKNELAIVDDLLAGLDDLKNSESSAWTELIELHNERTKVRLGFADSVGENLGSLRIRVDQLQDPSQWNTEVRSAFGFREGDHTEALEKLESWLCDKEAAPETRLERLEEWRDALLSGDCSGLITHSSNSFANRVETRSEQTRLSVATLRPDDRLDLRFLKEGCDPDHEASWQSVESGSPGQRSAAMLAFILSYGNSPLILDQPEDDLDSRLVSDLVVSQFRRARWNRQLIVVTHEANIPVNTDAERVVSLENVDGSLRIVGGDAEAHSGPLDDARIRKDIQDLLEGGVQAFVNRERRYDNELSRYRSDLAKMPSQES